MAASRAVQAGLKVRVFDKRKAPGRKLLVAGSSGLNITYECGPDEFVRYYSEPRERFTEFFKAFGPLDWRTFIQKELGIPTFKGTSRRWFVASEGMKASGLLKAWVEQLTRQGVSFELGRECVGFESSAEEVRLRFADGGEAQVSAACFCLGGGSWEPSEQPLRWPVIFRAHGLEFREFAASNVGFQVDWPEALLAEAEGKPIKNVVLSSSRGERSGDLVITRYGIEGTPVYFAGETGQVTLDLKPDLSEEQLLRKLELVKENLSPLRRAKRHLNLGEGALALLFHLGAGSDLKALAARIKKFPLELRAPQPLNEAISSSGGLSWSELDPTLMLKKFPGVFAAGEMIDWDAPTGGFLIQACVSQGHWAGQAMADYCAHGSF
jgi:uncharacterized flavoprotein (TIGR03862 family)